jgi:hypothetical protein
MTIVLRRSLVAAALALTLGAGSTQAATPKLPADALVGPAGTDLVVALPAGTTTVRKLVVTILSPSTAGRPKNRVVAFADVPVVNGRATVALDDAPRGSDIRFDAAYGDGSTEVPRSGNAIARLRPDLRVAAVHAPPQTLTRDPVDVVVDLEEALADSSATATLTLVQGGIPIASMPVELDPGGDASPVFEDVHLTTASRTELTARIERAEPAEYDAANNEGSTEIDVTEHALQLANVLVPSLAGYGAQFNNHVYAPITPWPPGTGYEDFEAKAKALQPHIVRIFYNDNWDGNRDGRFPSPIWEQNYASFVKVVELAQEAGAIIDISFQNLANARFTPIPDMKKFADVLEDLVRNHELTNVRFAEVGNEPNSGGTAAVSLAEYETLVRTLDAELRARGLRDHIRMMGPGLVENAGVPSRTHYVWLKHIAANMGDVLDAWGQHIYWNYNDTGRLEYRLRDIWNLVNKVIPAEFPAAQLKPTYMMEYGVRGLDNCAGKPLSRNTYYAVDPSCPSIQRTNIAGFQQFWFAVASAQLGYVGAAKWDAYWGVYDFTLSPPQVYWTIGPAAEGSPLMPSYHSLALLFHTTVPGWQVVGVQPWDASDWTVPTHGIEGHSSNDTPEKELAAYAGPDGELTILGLDTNGRALNGLSAEPPSQYSIGELPASTTFTLAVWNAAGDGKNTVAATVTTNAAGVARFQVPLHAAFALTTVPVS